MVKVPPLEVYPTVEVMLLQLPEEEQTVMVAVPVLLPVRVRLLPLIVAPTAAVSELLEM